MPDLDRLSELVKALQPTSRTSPRGMTAGAVVRALEAEGCQVLDEVEESEYGKFAWVMDPEGNKVELWQPPAGQ